MSALLSSRSLQALGIGLLLLLVQLVLIGVSLQQDRAALHRQARQDLVREAMHLAQSAQPTVHEQVDRIEVALATVATDLRVVAAVVADVDGRVLFAHRREWIGQTLAQCLPAVSAEQIDEVAHSQVFALIEGGSALRPVVLMPFIRRADPGQLRSDRNGLVVLEFDLGFEESELLRRAGRRLLQQLAVTLALVLLLAWAWRAVRRQPP